ncbi:acetylornithine deacetylase [Arboricoccus pini]|uniref:acetylornithine deacetylase n=1 Tax=Arboricoccus pini TaxID=1963835 RepID=UPI0013FDB121|nr:acetylornithine deacetylase [Arboricoccus pini]
MTVTIELLEQLVGFETVSGNSNLDLVEFVAGRLRAAGAECRVLPDPQGQKANLLAWIGPTDRPGLVLSGHSDVVPVTGQRWSGNPFALRRQDDRLIARGAADMKGFDAAAIALFERIDPTSLRHPLILALSFDEEVGCKGAPPLIHALLETLPAPLGCIVGEPTMMEPVDGHKGKVAMAVEIKGRAGHSALPHKAANAVFAAAQLIAALASRAAELQAEGPFAAGFEPAWTTLNVGRIEGGSQINIVPDRCRFEFEVRALPGTDPRDEVARVQRLVSEQVLPAMSAQAEECDIRFTELLRYPGFQAPEQSMIVRTVRDLTGGDEPAKVSYGTEAGLFAQSGIDVCVCGPGSIDVAHKPDEWITVGQLGRCDHFLDELVQRLCR